MVAVSALHAITMLWIAFACGGIEHLLWGVFDPVVLVLDIAS